MTFGFILKKLIKNPVGVIGILLLLLVVGLEVNRQRTNDG